MAVRDHWIWWSGLFTLPVLLVQGLRARRNALRLPGAPAPHCGAYEPRFETGSPPVAIFLVGESTVAGVGARDHAHGLSGRLAAALGERLSRTVRWEAIGLAGARARECLDGLIELELAPRLAEAPPDLLVVVLGANDTTKLTRRAPWRETIADIIARCRRETDCPIVFTGVPPMHRFTALPWPLRTVVGARARLLDDDLRRVTETVENCHHQSMNVDLTGTDLAVDGFHPSETGYARWAGVLAKRLAEVLEPTQRVVTDPSRRARPPARA